jgi:hypothetical protein
MKIILFTLILIAPLFAISQNDISVSIQNNYINSDRYESPLSYAVSIGASNDFIKTNIQYNPIKLIEKEVINGDRVDVELFRFTVFFCRDIFGFNVALGGYASHDLLFNIGQDVGFSGSIGYKLQDEVSIFVNINHSAFEARGNDLNLRQIGLGLNWHL